MAVAAVLALLLLPPVASLAHFLFEIPELTQLLEDRQPLLRELERLSLPRQLDQPSMLAYLMVFGLLASLCEELAFRGFILSGLLRAMRPRNAVLLSSFLFALFHMNVFQFLPAFLLGVVLGLLTVRSKSLVPAVIFQLLHNSMLIVSKYTVQTGDPEWITESWPAVIAICVLISFAMLWKLYRRPYVLARARQQDTLGL
jgi:membrane protease YdiL (CAAX protease family)